MSYDSLEQMSQTGQVHFSVHIVVLVCWNYDAQRQRANIMQSADRFREVNEMERDGRVSGNNYFANEINAVRARIAVAAAAAAVDGGRCMRRPTGGQDGGVSKQLQTSSGTRGSLELVQSVPSYSCLLDFGSGSELYGTCHARYVTKSAD